MATGGKRRREAGEPALGKARGEPSSMPLVRLSHGGLPKAGRRWQPQTRARGTSPVRWVLCPERKGQRKGEGEGGREGER